MNGATPYAAAALADERRRVADLAPGSQAVEFNKAALRIGAFVAGGELPAAEARAALAAAGLKMRNQPGREPWTRDALLAQIERAFRDARPRATPPAADGRARPRPAAAAAPPEPEDRGAEAARNIALALRLFAEARPAAGGPVETYLAARGVAWSRGFADLRFHPACPRGQERLPAMLALLRDARTGGPCGVHRTFLAPGGAGKIGHGQAKMMLGRARGAAVMLTPAEDVGHGLGVAEGIETALSAAALGWAPVWAAGSAGNLERFPVLPGVEALTVFADNGEAGAKAAAGCAERWRAAGREVRVRAPRGADDWNDALRLGRAAA